MTYKAHWTFPRLDENGTAMPFSIEVDTRGTGIMARFWYAYNDLTENGNPVLINELAGKQVVDTSGTIHTLPDANFMFLWASTRSDTTIQYEESESDG